MAGNIAHGLEGGFVGDAALLDLPLDHAMSPFFVGIRSWILRSADGGGEPQAGQKGWDDDPGMEPSAREPGMGHEGAFGKKEASIHEQPRLGSGGERLIHLTSDLKTPVSQGRRWPDKPRDILLNNESMAGRVMPESVFENSSWNRRGAFWVPPWDGFRHRPPEGGTPSRDSNHALSVMGWM
jgi:hypothetical protein